MSKSDHVVQFNGLFTLAHSSNNSDNLSYNQLRLLMLLILLTSPAYYFTGIKITIPILYVQI